MTQVKQGALGALCLAPGDRLVRVNGDSLRGLDPVELAAVRTIP